MAEGITNLEKKDPFADLTEEQEEGVQKEDIHIRIQQRNGRKTLTTIQVRNTLWLDWLYKISLR